MILSESCYSNLWDRGTSILKTQGMYYLMNPVGVVLICKQWCEAKQLIWVQGSDVSYFQQFRDNRKKLKNYWPHKYFWSELKKFISSYSMLSLDVVDIFSQPAMSLTSNYFLYCLLSSEIISDVMNVPWDKFFFHRKMWRLVTIFYWKIWLELQWLQEN